MAPHDTPSTDASVTPTESPVRSLTSTVDVRHFLEWSVQSYTVKTRKTRSSNTRSKTILQNLSGRTVSGELTAILGPSGAGKTTLLECISLRNRGFDGAVKYDGQPPTGHFFTTSAFLHQSTQLYGFMTPREYLTFHAIARMSGRAEGRTRADMHRRVEEILTDVKLGKCADTLIGGTDPVYMLKGISGGERKRLAIATELLLTPQLIFLDEPSSGLDSVMSESIFQTLKELTLQGRIVMASVHCPSSKTYHLFTTLILLTCDGRMAYSGPAAQALDYVEATFHTECPSRYNTADFLLELVSIEPGVMDMEEEKQRMDVLSSAYQASKLSASSSPPLPNDIHHKSLHQVRGLTASSWTLFKLNAWRASLQLKRDKVTIGLWNLVSAVIGTLFGILYWQQAGDNWRNLMGLLFSIVVAVVFSACLGVIMRFPLEWTLIVREYYSGANAIGPYILARFITTLPLSFGPFILATIVYWATGMDPNWQNYLVFCLIFISYNWSCFSLGQWISSFSANPLIAMTIMPVFVTPMIMFSGLLYERSSAPPWLGWIENVSLINYCFDSLLAQQMHILPDNQPEFLQKFIQYDPSKMVHNVAILWVMNACFQFFTYINLSVRLRVSQSVN